MQINCPVWESLVTVATLIVFTSDIDIGITFISSGSPISWQLIWHLSLSFSWPPFLPALLVLLLHFPSDRSLGSSPIGLAQRRSPGQLQLPALDWRLISFYRLLRQIGPPLGRSLKANNLINLIIIKNSFLKELWGMITDWGSFWWGRCSIWREH